MSNCKRNGVNPVISAKKTTPDRNFITTTTTTRIANSTKTRIINVGLQQLYVVDVKRGFAILLR